ncbi:MAG: hypothetical protein SFV81_21280 [Pirellulaceae bacterium]|nr:hypothetical protein [Pirellulaceae bacterium]
MFSDADGLVDQTTLEHFIHTSEVKRRGYDKLHLEDDKPSDPLNSQVDREFES